MAEMGTVRTRSLKFGGYPVSKPDPEPQSSKSIFLTRSVSTNCTKVEAIPLKAWCSVFQCRL